MAKKTSPSNKDMENPELRTHMETQKETTIQEPSASPITAEDLRERAGQPHEAAEEFLLKLRETLSKAVYTTCYGISYGVVYGGLVIGSFLPKGGIIPNNPLAIFS
jgi:hypothetical protein